MSNSALERIERRSARSQLAVAIRVFSNGSTEVRMGILRDISAYGAFVYADFSPELGARIIIDFVMHGTATDTRFTCEGVVVRVEGSQQGGKTGIAMQITRLDLAA